MRWFKSGWDNIWYGVSFVGDSAHLWCQVEGGSTWSNWIYRELFDSKEEIEGSLQQTWFWSELRTRDRSEVGISTKANISDPPEDRAQTLSWMLENLPKLRDVLNPELERILSDMNA